MPSLVPPGYTRGPILFMRPAADASMVDRLLQYFWDDAGAYGARILLIELDGTDRALTDSVEQRLRGWEADSVSVLTLNGRVDACRDHQAAVDGATALLLLTAHPLEAIASLGGTPLAQALRRANAQGKAVGAYGDGATLLCQHMIVPPPTGDPDGLFFAPGLGLVNRLGLDLPRPGLPEARLTAAVACNPFLVAVGLERGAGVAVYPDTTLECFGRAGVYIATADDGPDGLVTTTQRLMPRARYNFDARTFVAPEPSEIPEDDGPALSGF